MGGMAGLGRLEPDSESAPFKAAWEARVFAMVMAFSPSRNIDANRHARECIPGESYLQMSYFERWFQAFCDGLIAKGLVSPNELTTGRAEHGPVGDPALKPGRVGPAFMRQASYERRLDRPPQLAVGQSVRTRNLHPHGHTRLPRYVRGRVGFVERWHGAHVFPDAHAHGQGEDPQHLYTIRFSGSELWGESCDPNLSLRLDLWEPYLEQI